MVRWFDFAEPEFIQQLYRDPPQQWPKPQLPEAAASSAACHRARQQQMEALLAPVRATFAEFPIVTLQPRQPDIRDVIPVHRITGRWIAMATEGRYQLVCSIRSRLHG